MTNPPSTVNVIDFNEEKQKRLQPLAQDLAYSVLSGDFPMHFFAADIEGTLLGCNQRQLDLLGLTHLHQFVGKHVTDFVSETVWHNSQLCMKNKKKIMVEEEFHTTAGTRYFLSIKEPSYDDKGNVDGFVGLSIEITDRKENEIALAKATKEAEEANQAKTNFLININHEFRTSLTYILRVAEILSANESLSPELQEYVNILKLQAQKLWDITESLLDYQAVTKGTVTPEITSLDVVPLVTPLADETPN